MDLQLAGKVALVTGGSEGIGKGIARALAREGCDVAICARRPDVLDKAAAEIRAESGRRVVAIPADLTRREDAEHFVHEAVRALGRLDILVNNAGSGMRAGTPPPGCRGERPAERGLGLRDHWRDRCH
jgi:3-oxoacyl-[acyl-carrier protein] reductase